MDLGGGPRNDKLQNGVIYYFHDFIAPGKTTSVVSVKFPELMKDGAYRSVPGFTGPDVRAAEISQVPFPQLLDPGDDLPPATIITSAIREGPNLRVRGVTTDNGEVASVTVNGRPARRIESAPGVTDWEVLLPMPPDGRITARAVDRPGNQERYGPQRMERPAPGSHSVSRR